MVRKLVLSLGFLAFSGFGRYVVGEEVQNEVKNANDDNTTSEMLNSLAEARSKVEGSQETHQYQAEVTRLMDIIINSLYTQRDVFLRELISNSVDALEKARFLAIANKDVLADKPELDIHIECEEQQKILTICDSGVGMTKNELINNLGTVAKSGTNNFLEALAQSNNDINLIGQFGVGFYSAFLVANRVTVVSKNIEDDQYIWESSADAQYYIAKDPRGNTLKRGTCVNLHLKEDATEFLNEFKLKELISRYSQFMAYPIYLKVTKKTTEEVPIDEEESKEETSEDKKDKDDIEVKDEEEDTEKEKPKTKTVEKVVTEWEQLNTQKAIWLRPKEEVTEKEYTDFYKSLTKDWSEPMVHMHFSAEGEVEFKALLFIPKRSPADVFGGYFGKQTSIKLYVRRVLVADVFEDLLPKYLHFVRGVVDSEDLPLNVSREQLQQHKILGIISKKIVRKTLDTIRKMYIDSNKNTEELKKQLEEATEEDKKKEIKKQLKEPSEFNKFYKEYSRNLMLGCYEDDQNRSRIAKVLQFYTSKSPTEPVSLEQYVKNMPDSQNAIYYAAGESKEQLMNQPQMQIFKKKDFEVLFLLEAMDEPCVQRLMDFEGKKFESVQKGNINIEETPEEKKRYKQITKLYQPLLKWYKNKLGPKVTKVDISRRLVDAPCAVVASQWGYSAQMEKIMKTQTFADPMHLKMMAGQKVFELNPHHKVVQYLLQKVKDAQNNENNKEVSEADTALALQLFDTAMLASGFDIEKPADLAALLYKGIATEVGINPTEPLDENIELPEESESETDAKSDSSGDAPSAEDIFSDLNFNAAQTHDEL